MDLNQIVVFVRVVQAGGFSAAARRLGMPKSTVSRKVSDLEERIGARLLQRTTRKLGLTDAGRVYYERTARIVGEIDNADQAVGRLQTAPRGELRVTAPASFGMLGPIVAKYLERYPEVQVDIVCTDRRVDLVEERFDVAIRAGELADSSLIARSLGKAKLVFVAAPGYCRHHGAPQTPADLREHACIAFGGYETPNLWILESGGKRREVRVTPRLTANDFEVLRDATVAGAGIACLPEVLCAVDVHKGRLRRVLPDWSSAEVPVHALYSRARHLSPKVAAFLDLVAKELRLRI
jgi:DNA-binding transcriptional LysR family regulator